MKTKAGIIAGILCLLSVKAVATTDYGAVNHITKQCAYLEDDHRLYQPMLWEPVMEQHWDNLEEYSGYVYTEFPYRLDCWVLAGLVLMAGLIVVKLKRKKQ